MYKDYKNDRSFRTSTRQSSYARVSAAAENRQKEQQQEDWEAQMSSQKSSWQNQMTVQQAQPALKVHTTRYYIKSAPVFKEEKEYIF